MSADYDRPSRSLASRWFGPLRSGSLRSGLLVLTTTAMGAGVLALPFAISELGCLLGSAMVGLLAFLNVSSLELLLQAGMQFNVTSYSELTRCVGGPLAVAVLDSTVNIITWGATIAYFVFLKQLLPPLLCTFGVPSGLAEANVSLPVVAGLAFVIALPRDITALGKVSLLGVLNVLYLLSLLLLASWKEHGIAGGFPLSSPALVPDKGTSDDSLYSQVARFTNAGALVMSGYLCQYNIFFVSSDVKEPTMRRLRKITRLSTAFQAICYLLLGLCGYATFGVDTHDNIYTNMSTQDAFVNFGRLLVCMSLCISIPLCVFGARSNFVDLLGLALHSRDVPGEEQPECTSPISDYLTRNVDGCSRLYSLVLDAVEESGVHTDNPILRVHSDPDIFRARSLADIPTSRSHGHICVQSLRGVSVHSADAESPLLDDTPASRVSNVSAGFKVLREARQRMEAELGAGGQLLHVTVTAFVITTTLLLAFEVPSVSYLLGKLGGLCGAVQMYIMPGIVLWKCDTLFPRKQRILTLIGFSAASVVCLGALLF